METDYISRKAVETFLRSRNYCLDTEADIEYVVECLSKEIPSADVRPVKLGEWMDTEDTYADPPARQTCRCSNCGRVSPRPLGDFCRWCGADMRPEGETP